MPKMIFDDVCPICIKVFTNKHGSVTCSMTCSAILRTGASLKTSRENLTKKNRALKSIAYKKNAEKHLKVMFDVEDDFQGDIL